MAARTSTGYAQQVSLIDLADGIRPDAWVLVTAASGGAGSLLVQLARAAGARVVAAARGEHKLELARERGADVTVDYSEPGWPQRVLDATGGAGADVTFDGGGGPFGDEAFEATAEGGRFVTYGTSNGLTEIDPDLATRRRVSVRYALAGGPPDAETAPGPRAAGRRGRSSTRSTSHISPAIRGRRGGSPRRARPLRRSPCAARRGCCRGTSRGGGPGRA